MRFKADGDFDKLRRYLLTVHVQVIQGNDGFITLRLMLRPKTAFHAEQELKGYVHAWNLLNPYQGLEIVETFG